MPSSRTSTGTLPSGLNACTGLPGAHGETSWIWYSIFFSASAMRTLRTKGLVNDAISLSTKSRRMLAWRDENYSIARTFDRRARGSDRGLSAFGSRARLTPDESPRFP